MPPPLLLGLVVFGVGMCTGWYAWGLLDERDSRFPFTLAALIAYSLLVAGQGLMLFGYWWL